MCAAKASSRPLNLILVISTTKPMHAKNSFENKVFQKTIIKKALKSQLGFFFQTQSHFMDKIMKKKRGLELCGPFILENGERKGKKLQKYLESKKSFLDEIVDTSFKIFQ